MRLGSDNNCCSVVYVASLELQCLSLTMTIPRVVIIYGITISGGYYKLTCNATYACAYSNSPAGIINITCMAFMRQNDIQVA